MNTKVRKLMFRKVMLMAALLLSLIFTPASQAAPLAAFGPRDLPIPPGTGFPLWYQDSTGLSVGLCTDAASGFCIFLADEFFNPGLPVSFPSNFPAEHFYYLAETFAGPLFYRTGIEGGFGGIGNPADGQQAVFSRIRFRAVVPAVGTYTVTHPYGVETFVVAALTPGIPEINQTLDIFGLVPLSFNGPTDASSAVGPFLRAAATPGGAPLPFQTDAAGNTYLANPAASVPVTGSPLGTNFVEIRNQAGVVIGRSDTFNIAGKIVGLTASPAAVAFPAQKPAVVSAAQVVTITNPDTVAPATLGAVALTGANAADFTLGPDTCSGAPIPASGTCTVTVTFSEPAPGVNGAKTALLSFPVTAPVGRPPVIINLSGTIDTIRPTVTATNPANNGLNFPANNAITATFSEPVTGVTGTTFTLSTAGTPLVAGAVTFDAASKTATFRPAANLTPNATYTATITTGVADIAGNALAANSVFIFQTTNPDTTPPQVASSAPANNATHVKTADPLTVTFNAAVLPSSVNSTTFFLSEGVTGAVTYDPATRTMKFTPDKPLAFFHAYTMTVTTGVQSLGTVPMAANFTATFFTNGAPNIPALLSPADGATVAGTAVEVKWIKAKDADNDPVNYHVWVCTNPGMVGCSPVDTAGNPPAPVAAIGGYGAAMLLAGFVSLRRGRARRKMVLFLAMVAMTAVVTTSCGGGGGDAAGPAGPTALAAPDPATIAALNVPGLKTGTTYYWKVVADDGNGAQIESATRQFVTQ